MTRRPRPAAAIRSLRALVALVLAGALLAGCTGAPEDPDASARPVTTEESQLLAIARFRNFDAGSRPFTTAVRERGADLELRGWIDHASHVGYAIVSGAFEPEALLWTGATVGVIPASPDADGNPPLPIPSLDDQAWLSHALDPSSSRLDSLLAAIGALGSDRPDNPLLLQQAGALWLRADEIDGTPVTVFAAPPSDDPVTADSPPIDAETSALRLWVDEEGLIMRAEVRVGDSWSTVDFSGSPGVSLTLPDSTGNEE